MIYYVLPRFSIPVFGSSLEERYASVQKFKDVLQASDLEALANQPSVSNFDFSNKVVIALTSRMPSAFFRGLSDQQLSLWYPELLSCKGVEQNEHHAEDLFNHLMEAIDAACNLDLQKETVYKEIIAASQSLHVKLAVLFHDLGKVEADHE